MDRSSHLKSGSLLQGGKYRIERALGQGGFGITYLALQMGLNRNVAIKEFFMKELCNRDTSTSEVSVGSEGSKDLVERFRKKFIKEAQTIAGMNNNHIIKIHDIFEENGTAYYVMEYLENGDLESRIPETGLPLKESLDYIFQIGDALSYIHKKNILHLDIKPSNVLFSEDSEAVLIDFGISKHYDEDGGGQTSSTPVGMSRGYAPLEQYRQGGILHFSPSTDIYSFGATIYNMLTGVRPPDADEVQEDGLPPMPDKIPAYLKAAVEKAMSPRRKDRPQSVEEFISLLRKNGDDSVKVEVIREGEETRYKTELEHNGEQAAISEGVHSGHEWVDLGLSVKWATCNVGANSPSDYGNYYAWGETMTKSEYTAENCKTWGKNMGDISGNPSYDAARANWGGKWRLPSISEFEELKNRCKWQWITQNGHNGYRVTGPNGNSIFLPAANWRYSTSFDRPGWYGFYWSSFSNEGDAGYAYFLSFGSRGHKVHWHYRSYGLSVRPVLD